MAYNMTDFTNSGNIFGMYEAVNTASGSVFSYMLIIVIFIIVLFSLLRNNPPAESFTAASAALVAVSLMFLLADMINVVWVVGATLLFAAAAVNLMNT